MGEYSFCNDFLSAANKRFSFVLIVFMTTSSTLHLRTSSHKFPDAASLRYGTRNNHKNIFLK